MNVGRIKLRYVNLNNSYDVTLVQLSTHIHRFVFIEAIGYEIVHFFSFLEFNSRRELWEFFC